MSEQLDDEVVFQTARGPLDKETFLEFVAALFAAFPDWRIDHHEPRDSGNLAVAVVTVRMRHALQNHSNCRYLASASPGHWEDRDAALAELPLHGG